MSASPKQHSAIRCASLKFWKLRTLLLHQKWCSINTATRILASQLLSTLERMMPQRYLWPNTQHPASFLRSDSTCRKVTECSTILCLFFEIFEVRLWMLVQEATIGQRWIPSRLLHFCSMLLPFDCCFSGIRVWWMCGMTWALWIGSFRNVPHSHWAELWYLLILSSWRFRCFNTIQYVCFSFMSFRRHLTSQSHCSCTCWVPHHCGWPAECSLEWCAASCSPGQVQNTPSTSSGLTWDSQMLTVSVGWKNMEKEYEALLHALAEFPASSKISAQTYSMTPVR